MNMRLNSDGTVNFNATLFAVVRTSLNIMTGMDTARHRHMICCYSHTFVATQVQLPKPKSEQSWVQSQHPPTQWNLRGGR
jgi:hypothetical protein